jgi:replicative DNA helicase
METSNKPDGRTSRQKKSVAPSEDGGRIQPQARELEEAVLGALMLEKEAFSIISDTLSPACFYDKTHELIFTAIRDLAVEQKPIDVLTVVEQLRRKGDLETVGGASYIAQLSQKVVSSAHLGYHARIVAQKYLARELITFSSNVSSKAFDETNDVEDVMNEAERQLFEMSQRNLKKDVTHISPVIAEARRLIDEAVDRKGGFSGLQTGFHDLDKITAGWQNSDLIIIAARPSMGKTAFVLSMAKNMAVNYKIPVAMFSLEMSNIQLVNRLLINVSSIKGDKIKSGKLEPYERKQLDSKIKDLYYAPIYIDDTPALSIFELRTKSRRLVKEHDVKCIIIDYLQLMTPGDKDSKSHFQSRENDVRIISNALKALAKELNIPVIALSQLNRNVENRAGRGDGSDAKRPQLSDLRESGAIEQDADIVCFIHRPEYYRIFSTPEGINLEGKAEIIIAKHRNGSTGDIWLSFKNEFIRFQNLEDDRIYEEYSSKVNGQTGSSTPEKNEHSANSFETDLNVPY